MRFRYIGLRAMTSRGELAVKSAINSAADELVNRSRAAAPKGDSGELALGIHTGGVLQGAGSGASMYYAVVETGEAAKAYAQYIHEGHNTHGTHVIGAYPSGAKYMEGPLLTMRGPLLRKLREASRAAF